jgi:hypothetical protein
MKINARDGSRNRAVAPGIVGGRSLPRNPTDVHGERKRLSRIPYQSRADLSSRILQVKTLQFNDDPAGLFRVIMLGLRANLADMVLPAANRLAEIDPVQERGRVCCAMVLGRIGRQVEALGILKHWLRDHPESHVAMTAISELYETIGQHDEAGRFVKMALSLPNGFGMSRVFDSVDGQYGGEMTVLNELRNSSMMSASWTPNLWKARVELFKGNHENAADIYRRALESENGSKLPQLLCLVSVDLHRVREYRLEIETIAQFFDARIHNSLIGINLVHAYVDLEHGVSALNLIRDIRLWHDGQIDNHLDYFEGMIGEKGNGPIGGIVEGSISLLSSAMPLWWHHLFSPEWMIPESSDPPMEVIYLICATVPGGDSSADEAVIHQGLLGIQLSLRDHFVFQYGHGQRALIAIRNGAGLASICRCWTKEELASLSEDLKGSTWIVTGTARCEEAILTMTLQVHDAKSLETVCSFDIMDGIDNMDSIAIKARERLQLFFIDFGHAPKHKLKNAILYQHGDTDERGGIVAQALVCQLLLGYEHSIPMPNVYNIISRVVSLAENHPRELSIRMALSSILLADHASGSLVYLKFAKRVLKILDSDCGDGVEVLRLLSPLTYMLYGIDKPPLLSDEAYANGITGYQEWRASIDSMNKFVLADESLELSPIGGES